METDVLAWEYWRDEVLCNLGDDEVEELWDGIDVS